MNIEQALLAPTKQTKAITYNIAEYAVEDPSHFEELITCFNSSDDKLSPRAAWALSFACMLDSTLALPYLPCIINHLSKNSDAVKRNSLRVLHEIEIPVHYHGEITNLCFNLTTDSSQSSAIKSYSLGILGKFCKLYPDLRNEVKIIINDQMPYESAAFKSRGRNILKLFNKK